MPVLQQLCGKGYMGSEVFKALPAGKCLFFRYARLAVGAENSKFKIKVLS